MVGAPKGGGPERWGPKPRKSGGHMRWGGGPNFRALFSSSRLKFHSLCSLWASFRGISGSGVAAGDRVRAPAARSGGAAMVSHDDPENSKRAFWRAPALQTPPKFHEKTPRESTKRKKLGGEKKTKFWAVQQRGSSGGVSGGKGLGLVSSGGGSAQGGSGGGHEKKIAQKSKKSKKILKKTKTIKKIFKYYFCIVEIFVMFLFFCIPKKASVSQEKSFCTRKKVIVSPKKVFVSQKKAPPSRNVVSQKSLLYNQKSGTRRGAQLVIDAALVSTIRADGTARGHAAHRDGVALEEARRTKERKYQSWPATADVHAS